MAQDPSSLDEDLALPAGARLAAVVSTFHEELTGAMLESARSELARLGGDPASLLVVHVPGSFELPLIARRLAMREDVDAVLCLGLVLKGETTHDRYVAQAAAQGIAQASLAADKPVLFGVLTCDTLEQARARALPREQGGTHDKGREVARAAAGALAALRAAAHVGRPGGAVGFGRSAEEESR